MNQNLLLIGIVILVIIAAAIGLRRKTSPRDAFTGNVESSGKVKHVLARPMSQPAPAAAVAHTDLESKVRALVRSRKLIEAIKLVREDANIGLKEAKDMVDNIGTGAQSSTSVLASTTFGNAHINVDDEALRLLEAGEKVEAIKFVREHKQLSLKDAKEYVERL
jgi:ribosomal protein L7/L12